jgi:hypothetical protein
MKEQFFYLYKLKAYSLLLFNVAILLLLNRVVGKGDFFIVHERWKRHENNNNNAVETVTTGFFEYKLPKIFIKSLLTFNCLARSGTSFGSPC